MVIKQSGLGIVLRPDFLILLGVWYKTGWIVLIEQAVFACGSKVLYVFCAIEALLRATPRYHLPQKCLHHVKR